MCYAYYATNIVQSAVSVLMPIGLDHMEYLGETIEEIARTKSGIIKPESHVVLAAQEPEVARILLEKVVEKSAIPYREGIEFALAKRDIAVGGQLISVQGIYGEYTEIYLPLHGAHQASNAAIAIATVEAFVGVKLDEDLVRSAFGKVSSPGRLEILHRDPTVIVDAAHNPHGARALAETLRSEFDFESIFCVLGILGEKDARGVLVALEPVVDRLVVTKSDSPRALPVLELFEAAVAVFGIDRVFKEEDLNSAITYAMEQVTLINQVSEGVSAVVITGSVVTAGAARVIVRKIGRAEVA
jgi:dihydrofolate synthase/folylpolyglutamate synthase